MIFRNDAVCGIKGLQFVDCTPHRDERGTFTEVYNARDLEGGGIKDHFVQDNEVFTRKHYLRGFDVNLNHPQAKLLRVLKGRIIDAVIDMRGESPTYLRTGMVMLSGRDNTELYIPERFAHAYLALEDSVVQFKTTGHYIPGDEISFAWDSGYFNIKWPEKELIKAAPYPEFDPKMLRREDDE